MSANSAPSDRRKVLVVDNHEVILEYLDAALSQAGFEVTTASGGLEALQHMQAEVPDVAVIDLVMPYIDGAQLASFMRKEERLKDVFIVLLSGIAVEARKEDYTHLCDAYVAKGPFDTMKQHILNVLEDFFRGQGAKYADQIVGVDGLYYREITKELLFSLKHLKVLVNVMDEGVIEVTPSRQVVYANAVAARYLGDDPNHLLGKDVVSLWEGEGLANLFAIFDRAEVAHLTEYLALGDRSLKVTLVRVEEESHKSDLMVFHDVTDELAREREMTEELDRRETTIDTLRERARTMVSLISGFISFQKNFVHEEEAARHLDELSTRVNSSLLLLDSLDTGQGDEQISVADYLSDLAELVVSAHADRQVLVRVSRAEIPLPVDSLIILGLAVTEILVNAIRHGFAPRLAKDSSFVPEIVIDLEGGEAPRIAVANNGVPMPPDVSIETGRSMGFTLIRSMTEQLGARISLETHEATRFVIQFPSPT